MAFRWFSFFFVFVHVLRAIAVRRRVCAQEKMLCNAGRHEFCDVINYLHQRGTDAPQNKSLNLKLCLNFGNELCRGPAAVRVYLVLNVCKSQYGVCGD